MGDLQVMSASMDSDPDIALFREELVILKRDVASLIGTHQRWRDEQRSKRHQPS